MKLFHRIRYRNGIRTVLFTGAALAATAPVAHTQTPPPTPPTETGANPPMFHADPLMAMSSSIDLLAPMTQEASGTAWLPASSPMYGKMLMYGDGSMLMLHGAVTPRYVSAGGKRGDNGVGAPNWFMAMYQRPLGPQAQIGLRAMLSLDPLTEGGYGYPLLFQTGESWRGQPLHDRQHPHDLFSELSVSYSRRLAANTSGYLYIGYPGEPAIGPPTFMHRLIAFDLPDAPIGHHWQDATHITFGVATAGLNFGNRVKVEGSVFNGREPNENRYNFDTLRFDSQSGRVFFNSDNNNSFQIGYGFQKNPEGDQVNQHRTTASWVYNKPLGTDANFTSTLSWGQNFLANEEGKSNSYLVEAIYQSGRRTFFSRLEHIQKSGHELVLPEAYHENKYAVGAYTVGYMYDLTHGKGIDTGVGAAITVNAKPSSLSPFYGTQNAPVGFQVLFRLRPSRTRAGSGMAGMTGMPGMAPMDHGAMTPAEHAQMEGMRPNSAPEVAPQTPPVQVPPAPLVPPNPATPQTAPVAPPANPPAPPQTPVTPTATIPTVSVAATPAIPKARQKTKITITVTRSDNKPLAGASVRATGNMTAMDMGALKPTFKEISIGKYQGDVTFSMPGVWRLSVVIVPKGATASQAIRKTVDYNVAQ